MKAFKDYTLEKYLDVLASREPVPGGGSAAALTAALGAALLSMVANYSTGKSRDRSINQKIKSLLSKSEKIRKRLLKLVDLDARAYLKVVEARGKSPQFKRQALRKACEVPLEVCQLCYQSIQLAPILVQYGNRFLLSDVECAAEMLLAAFHSAKINVETNQ